MPKKTLLVLALILVLLASPAGAKSKVTCHVKAVAQHEMLVTFEWELSVQSDRAWDACDVILSFQDEAGREIHVTRETISLKAGTSAHAGHDICDSGVWKRIKKYVATLDCVF